MATDLRTHNNIKTTSPTTLSINLGSTCNLTCSYCCKQYSSSWRQDILTNGAYLDQDRFTITAQDKILLKLSQADHTDSEAFNLILDETTSFDQLQTLSFTGGEPFLYNKLPELLNRFSWVPHISITTGLGVNPVRFRTQLKKIKNTRNLEIVVSAENCNNSYEFNRYNNSWTNFLTNLEVIKNQKIKFNFTSVISNLTIFGLADFIDQFSEPSIINWCSDPEFLSVNVLDDASKKQIITQFKNKDFEISDRVISSIEMPCTEQQRQHLSVYLSEFAKRRQLSLDIFPASMLQWLKL
jgi:MoaA/NifB/PqqE/SkfB family radical SAM enzyme